MMTLNEWIAPWLERQIQDIALNGLQNDSRNVKPNDAFLAYKGSQSDGRLFINDALKAGASAVLFDPEDWPSTHPFPNDHRCIVMPHLVERLPELAKRFYRDPSAFMHVTGVTGTNGKTTIAYLLAQAHRLMNRPSAYVGTLGYGLPDALHELANTTPDAVALQSMLHTFQSEGIHQVCMEVSSHALTQRRVEGIRFEQAIFTNLSHEHLDYHRTMEAYAHAKSKLFATPHLAVAILNTDDPFCSTMRNAVSPTTTLLTYGIQSKADVHAVKWDVSMTGTSLTIQSPWGRHSLTSKALGYFNASNLLAVFTSLLASGFDPDTVVDMMADLQPAPGRMEIVLDKPCVIVDYAHTPDALENVLKTLSAIKKGRILTVFGCGGNRDTSKRPQMGRIASQYSDITVVTSDNPRYEDPNAIMNDIVAGMPKHDYQIVNRKEAIEQALALAQPEDIVVIAGKGHERYQHIGDVKHPFSDRDMVLASIRT